MSIGIKVAAAVVGLALSGLLGTSGNGKLKEEVRAVGDFSGVEVSHGIQATVTVGPKTSVKLEAEENLLPLIKTEVENGKLTTRVQGNIHPTHAIKLTVVTPQLSAVGASGGASLTAEATPAPRFDVDASGGSRVTVNGIRSDTVEIEASGASQLTLSGTGKQVMVDVSGATVLNAEALAAGALKVQASGASQTTARVSDGLTAELSGASNLRVKGNPQKRQVDTSGGARISFE